MTRKTSRLTLRRIKIIRSPKILGLCLATTFALCAAGASIAPAAEFHTEISNPVLTGAQTKSFGDQLAVEAGNVECEAIAYTGLLSGGGATAAQLSLKPSFSECTSTFGSPVTVDTNECEYAFHSEGGKVDLVCPGATKAISITTPGCEVTVPEQSGLGGITYTNAGTGSTRDLTIDSAINGIDYEEHTKGSIPTCATITKTNGAYTGKTTVTAENGSKEQKGLWIEGSEFHSEVSNPVLTGSQPAKFEDKLAIDAGNVTCETIAYTGSLPGGGATAAQLNLKPSFSECTSTFGLNVTVDTNECEYVFHSESGKVDLVCPGATKAISITTPGCEVTVPEQSGLGGITYTNAGSGSSRDVAIDPAITGVEYEEHDKGFFPTCNNDTAARTNGSYAGKATVTAETGQGLWVEGSEFHSEGSNPTLTGAQTKNFGDILTVDVGKVQCNTISYAGSLSGGGVTTAQLKLKPSFSECTYTFGVSATIDINECEYVFHSESGQVDLVCPGATKAISITLVNCVVTIPEQSGLEGIAYTNAGTGSSRDLTIDLSTSGIKYEEHNKGFFPTCKANTVAKSNGTYNGEATVTAENGTVKQKGIWVE